MARAGFCSACGANVWLTPEGGCSNGHGPEFVSGSYETDPPTPAPAPTPAQAAASATPVAPAAPAQTYIDEFGRSVDQFGDPLPEKPKKKTGLIIAIVLLALIFLCGCPMLLGVALFSAPATDYEAQPDPQSTPEVPAEVPPIASDEVSEPTGALVPAPAPKPTAPQDPAAAPAPELVTVPDIEGISDPDPVLKKAGLIGEGVAVHGPIEADHGEFMEAYRQQPRPGTRVPKGTKVTYRFWYESQ